MHAFGNNAVSIEGYCLIAFGNSLLAHLRRQKLGFLMLWRVTSCFSFQSLHVEKQTQ